MPRGGILAVDSASLEAEKPEGDGARGDDTPLVRVHGAEVANQIAPGIKKPEAQGKIGEKGGEHGELGWDLGVRRRVTRDQSRGYAQAYSARRSVRKSRLRQAIAGQLL